MTETTLLGWLKEQQPTLDAIIANSGCQFYEQNRQRPNFVFDLAECQYESYHLIRGRDLCYDRPNTAFCYSLWYHARRVNTFLSHFAKIIFNTTDTEVEIFDLGAGTGAVQWAVGLVYHKMKAEGKRTPKIRIINVDTSPFMLYYSRDFLWKNFLLQYPNCQELNPDIEYEVNSWSNSRNTTIRNPWITASYLFDISDTTADGQINAEYKASLRGGFAELVKNFNPSHILLLTSDQPPKRMLLNELKSDFAKSGYHQQEIASSGLLLNGQLVETSRFRKQLYDTYLSDLTTTEAQSLGRAVDWKDFSFVGTVLTKQQGILQFSDSVLAKQVQDIKLYNSAIVVRRDIILNDDQKKAAEHSDRPTIITGPAGCGKSVVITERIKNLVEAKSYDTTLNILVTTFNKQLMSCLGNWIEEILDKSKTNRVGNTFHFLGSRTPNITLMHFDILPTRIGGTNGALVFNNTLRSIASEAVLYIKREKGITTSKHDKVLNPDYVVEEYHRIVYGLQYGTESEFLTSERTGRPKLKKDGTNRKLLWETILQFLNILQKRGWESIVLRRHKLLRKLKRGEIKTKFTHIFVDEFQDCTLADYEIFYNLLSDPNNLVIAGDIAQAIQLGAVADVPRAEGELMQRRVIYKLKGSYRLPFRICECISKISEMIENGSVVTPYKGSPPGARPIVVYASTAVELKQKLHSVYQAFESYGLDRITILESNPGICQALKELKIPCETDTILKLKGLEKTCVLWSTEIDIEYKDEVEEFVYTILSRTSGILIVALTDNTLAKYHKVIKALRPDRLIFWDKQTKEKFNSFCQDDAEENILEDDD